MNVITWIVLGGIAGWLTGKLIGEKGYGRGLSGGYTRSIDIFFGCVGASIGGYLFFWAVLGEGSSLSNYTTAILGSITLVGFIRQVSTGYLPFSFR
jgi:uncharacterized membrane protein YeaQ/YmgE (transglycosylase-associated protein family)